MVYFMGIMESLLENPVVISLFFSWLVAQTSKFLIALIMARKVEWRNFINMGGMPSSHTAFVASLCTAVFMLEGLSTVFFVSCVLAIIVIRDAIGVRMVVEKIGKEVDDLTRRHRDLRVGHTPAQVVVGAMVGIVVTVLVFWL